MERRHDAQVRVLAEVTGREPELQPFGPKAAGYALGVYDDYPRAGLRTTVTFGLAHQGGSMWRGLTLGNELVMTRQTTDLDGDSMIQAAVLENRRRLAAKDRRRLIELNGVYAPGYPPHLLFTTQATACPELMLARKKVGDHYVNIWAAIAIDDRELRLYDRSSRLLIAELQDPARVETYPRDAL